MVRKPSIQDSIRGIPVDDFWPSRASFGRVREMVELPDRKKTLGLRIYLHFTCTHS